MSLSRSVSLLVSLDSVIAHQTILQKIKRKMWFSLVFSTFDTKQAVMTWALMGLFASPMVVSSSGQGDLPRGFWCSMQGGHQSHHKVLKQYSLARMWALDANRQTYKQTNIRGYLRERQGALEAPHKVESRLAGGKDLYKQLSGWVRTPHKHVAWAVINCLSIE